MKVIPNVTVAHGEHVVKTAMGLKLVVIPKRGAVLRYCANLAAKPDDSDGDDVEPGLDAGDNGCYGVNTRFQCGV